MILDLTKYLALVEKKYLTYSELISDNFNKQNNTSMIEVDDRIKYLHQLMNSGQEFDKSLFTEEEYSKRDLIDKDEKDRIDKVMKGEYTPYMSSEEDINILSISLKELLECTIPLEEVIGNIDGKVKE